MVRVYREKDADLKHLDGRTVAIIGYGNQGRMQALNLRDSGVAVIVGGREDESLARAEAEGFSCYSTAGATERADLVFLLLPDEVQPRIYEHEIAPALTAGKCLDFASGYNIAFGLIRPPADVDVIMVAPRMIGEKARELFLEGKGAPAMVSVEQDATGNALALALAVAKGLGATRAGAFEGSCRIEAEMDLFAEQVIWAGIMEYMKASFEIGVEHGFNPELLILEMVTSGEMAEIARAMADTGFFRQMDFHSHTSQYGTLSRGPRIVTETVRQQMRKHLRDEVASGAFAAEWTQEQEAGLPDFTRLKKAALSHPINRAEDELKRLIEG